ncbi:MAG: molybdopterin-dependent oxidoreductase [Candidatus Heimdallarchaeota archaeon]|nr:molybdopterin-dependent oxidoreductase [Candidatus Heimdallarchaeota archaeon]
MVKRKTIAIVIVINIVLIATLVPLYFTVFNKQNPAEEWTLKLTGDIANEIELAIPDLEEMPSLEKEYYLQGNPSFSAEYTGVKLWYLVTQVANITGDVTIRIAAIDQYSYSLNLAALNSDSEIIIAYKKNGEYIKSYFDGGEGPLRLIIPQRFEGEFNGQYCVKYVNEIDLSLSNKNNFHHPLAYLSNLYNIGGRIF